jgi:hypothetical protein
VIDKKENSVEEVAVGVFWFFPQKIRNSMRKIREHKKC